MKKRPSFFDTKDSLFSMSPVKALLVSACLFTALIAVRFYSEGHGSFEAVVSKLIPWQSVWSGAHNRSLKEPVNLPLNENGALLVGTEVAEIGTSGAGGDRAEKAATDAIVTEEIVPESAGTETVTKEIVTGTGETEEVTGETVTKEMVYTGTAGTEELTTEAVTKEIDTEAVGTEEVTGETGTKAISTLETVGTEELTRETVTIGTAGMGAAGTTTFGTQPLETERGGVLERGGTDTVSPETENDDAELTAGARRVENADLIFEPSGNWERVDRAQGGQSYQYVNGPNRGIGATEVLKFNQTLAHQLLDGKSVYFWGDSTMRQIFTAFFNGVQGSQITFQVGKHVQCSTFLARQSSLSSSMEPS
jgi:hypothetical protein